ncbi:histidine kinase [Myxococcus xanthus]|uniref:histidine kinase n=2 Tax=Myxococcus xanthus TaxID=34 RepID=A0AAE6G898_MYXXA|nr:histidine kinase [Myxococcus xanthus]QDE80027.1 histidine kinase [Myxococcus xanthus]QDF08497.1 histidine kinase [Myxococcus xanthus]
MASARSWTSERTVRRSAARGGVHRARLQRRWDEARRRHRPQNGGERRGGRPQGLGRPVMLETESRTAGDKEASGARTLKAAEFLRAHQEEVLEDWQRAMRAFHVGHAAQPSWLLDHMPQLLNMLADLIDHGPDEILTTVPDEHAMSRLDAGFDLGQVASEYALLRKCILHRMEAEAAYPAPGELERMEDALDRIVTRTVTSFSQGRQRILQALDRMTQAALDSPSMASLPSRLLTVLVESALSVDSAAFVLVEGDALVVRAAVGLGADEALGVSLEREEGFVGEVLRQRQPLTLRSASTDPRVTLPTLKQEGLRAVYGVPLLDGDQLLGMAYMCSRTAFVFSEPDALLFRTMAQRATAHLVQARLRARERQAHADAQRSLAQLDALLASTPLGIAQLDRELRFVRINQAMADIDGHSPEAHLGRRFQEMAPVTAVATFEPMFRRMIETGEPVDAVEFTIPGDARTFQASVHPVRTPDQGVLGLSCTVVDVSHHKRAEAVLQRAVDFREQLMAVLGHDLRNPLNAINASAFQLTRSEDLTPPERRAVDRIRKATARMGRMITDILDFARTRLGGGLPVARQPMDFVEVCQATLEELRVSAPERSLVFEAHGDTRGNWDPDRVSQVLGNLVANALQHGQEDRPVCVTVRGEAREVVLEVHNTGEPIASELMPRLFDPFKSMPATAPPQDVARKKRSLGLGLYIVSQIVGAHGGHVEVRSNRDQGTTFTVHWPRTLTTLGGA